MLKNQHIWPIHVGFESHHRHHIENPCNLNGYTVFLYFQLVQPILLRSEIEQIETDE